MVTPQGFNALLKIVEEPPEHLVFIFATTEPDKVLTTIRSRTHHYPFRLIAPTTLRTLLEKLCAEEKVTVEPAVFPLVIRAGGGSARDSLSMLDQLLAGAGPEGVTYRHAVALLGVTDAALLDEMVDALAAADGASVFGAVDRVVEAGHDPRRFAADLLQRLRDLLILDAVPDAAAKGLIDSPEDQLESMQGQAERLGVATLTRLAEVMHTGLVEMRGTTSPRLVLELMCARMLLPGRVDLGRGAAAAAGADGTPDGHRAGAGGEHRLGRVGTGGGRARPRCGPANGGRPRAPQAAGAERSSTATASGRASDVPGDRGAGPAPEPGQARASAPRTGPDLGLPVRPTLGSTAARRAAAATGRRWVPHRGQPRRCCRRRCPRGISRPRTGRPDRRPRRTGGARRRTRAPSRGPAVRQQASRQMPPSSMERHRRPGPVSGDARRHRCATGLVRGAGRRAAASPDDADPAGVGHHRRGRPGRAAVGDAVRGDGPQGGRTGQLRPAAGSAAGGSRRGVDRALRGRRRCTGGRLGCFPGVAGGPDSAGLRPPGDLPRHRRRTRTSPTSTANRSTRRHRRRWCVTPKRWRSSC